MSAMQDAAGTETTDHDTGSGPDSSAAGMSTARSRKSPGYNYRWEHVKSVVTLALILAHILEADEEVVEAAAWLHDITKEDGEEHADTGAEFARDFLVETDFPQEKIEEVAQAIADHKGLWRENPLTNLSSMILWDADKLSKLGLTAVIHWTGMLLARQEPLTAAGLVELKQNLDWQRKTVKSLHTKPAQNAAKQRLNAYELFWTNLEIELSGDDILSKSPD